MTTQLDHPTPTAPTPTPSPATRPDNPFAHAVTLATLVTETAVVIGATSVRPRRLSVFDYGDGACEWTIEVHVTTPAEVDEVGRAFALPLVDWADTLHVRYWPGVSLAGDLVNLRVLAGKR